MSETPRTDEVVGQREYGSLADSEYVRLARTLERELNEARQALSGRTVSCEICNETAKERDEWKACAEEQNKALSQCKLAMKFLFKRLDTRREEYQDVLTNVEVCTAVMLTDKILTTFNQLKEKSK